MDELYTSSTSYSQALCEELIGSTCYGPGNQYTSTKMAGIVYYTGPLFEEHRPRCTMVYVNRPCCGFRYGLLFVEELTVVPFSSIMAFEKALRECMRGNYAALVRTAVIESPTLFSVKICLNAQPIQYIVYCAKSVSSNRSHRPPTRFSVSFIFATIIGQCKVNVLNSDAMYSVITHWTVTADSIEKSVQPWFKEAYERKPGNRKLQQPYRKPAPTLFCLPGGSNITRHSKILFSVTRRVDVPNEKKTIALRMNQRRHIVYKVLRSLSQHLMGHEIGTVIGHEISTELCFSEQLREASISGFIAAIAMQKLGQIVSPDINSKVWIRCVDDAFVKYCRNDREDLTTAQHGGGLQTCEYFVDDTIETKRKIRSGDEEQCHIQDPIMVTKSSQVNYQVRRTDQPPPGQQSIMAFIALTVEQIKKAV
ncbi:hypothetical protein CLF_106884 [Clonorchis sinensis]|uniref:Uncharacterized protein n=1 Tax=Clonorchis sinensis TaxID=79923 RepID=G7YQ88_CLOSI|nr:hypothetical protein CLF_106884 [Clonorchis sinensis]